MHSPPPPQGSRNTERIKSNRKKDCPGPPSLKPRDHHNLWHESLEDLRIRTCMCYPSWTSDKSKPMQGLGDNDQFPWWELKGPPMWPQLPLTSSSGESCWLLPCGLHSCHPLCMELSYLHHIQISAQALLPPWSLPDPSLGPFMFLHGVNSGPLFQSSVTICWYVSITVILWLIMDTFTWL